MIDLEVFQQSIFKPKHPTVHHGVLVFSVRLLNSSRLDDVSALLYDAQFDEAIVPRRLVADRIQLFLVDAIDVANVPKPGVQQAQILGRHGSLDTAAAVMAAHDDVLDMEMAHGVLDDAHNIEVRVDDQVGDVAVDEGLAGPEARDLLGGNAGIAASNPEILGALSGTQLGEELGVLQLLLGSPGTVVVKHAVMGLLEILGNIRRGHVASDVVPVEPGEVIVVGGVIIIIIPTAARRTATAATGSRWRRRVHWCC